MLCGNGGGRAGASKMIKPDIRSLIVYYYIVRINTRWRSMVRAEKLMKSFAWRDYKKSGCMDSRQLCKEYLNRKAKVWRMVAGSNVS